MYTSKNTSYICHFDTESHQRYDSCDVIPRGDEIMLSSHKLAGYDNVVGKIPHDHYVVCVVYFKPDGTMLDVQLATTGSLMIKNISDSEMLIEDVKEGSVREVAEEIGFYIDKDYLENETRRKHKNHGTCSWHKSKNVTTFTVDIDHCVEYDPDLHSSQMLCTEENGWKDYRSNKVQILVHGELDKLLTAVEKIKNRIPSNDLHSIRAIRLMHQHDIYEAMKFLNGKRSP
jgi:hypothetical protein